MRSAPRRAARSVAALAACALLGLSAPASARTPAVGKPLFTGTDGEGGFYLWYDDSGWHLRGTGGGKQHAYHGVLRAGSGGIGSVKPTHPKVLKSVDVSGGAVRFDMDVSGAGVEGFDWQQTDPCVTAELKMDMRLNVKRIFVGSRAEHPDFVPFIACRD